MEGACCCRWILNGRSFAPFRPRSTRRNILPSTAAMAIYTGQRTKAYDALLLDAGGTLLQLAKPVAETYASIGSKFGVSTSVSEIKQGFKRAFAAPWSGKLRYQGDGRPFWRFVVSEATGSSREDYFEEVYEYYGNGSAWKLPAGAYESMQNLKASGVKLAVVSNFDTRLCQLLKDLDVAHLFDAIVISSEACKSVVGGISRKSARIAYCGLFALSLIISWILREVAAPLMEKIPWINHFDSTPDREWFETEAVLRVSLGNFLFFTILAVLMMGVKNQSDPRDRLHHGGWTAKVFCWFVLVALMFFLPNRVISFYETISKFGSGFFLLVQVVLLLDFVHAWNENWVSRDEQFWYMALLVVSLVCYVATFSFSAILFHFFTTSGQDCSLNIFFLVITLILVFIFAIVALHPKINGSLLPASVISLYCMYLCYSGLSSEPRDYQCNGLHNHEKVVSTGSMTLGLFTTILSVIYSAVRAGSSTALLSPPSSPRSGGEKPLLPFDKLEEQEDNKKDAIKPVSYSYTFFHLIFSLASMYSVMLLTGWSTSVGESGKLVDVGWPSVWVRMITGWATASLYIWSLIAPVVFPDREF